MSGGEGVGGVSGSGDVGSIGFFITNSTMASTQSSGSGDSLGRAHALFSTTSGSGTQSVALDPPDEDLLVFLTAISTNDTNFTLSTVQTQAQNPELFRDYFLGVALLIDQLERIEAEVITYVNAINVLTRQQYGNVGQINPYIKDYNNVALGVNYNITSYNNAVSNYNYVVANYSTHTGQYDVAYNAMASTANNLNFEISQNNSPISSYALAEDSFNNATQGANATIANLNATATSEGLPITLASSFPLASVNPTGLSKINIPQPVQSTSQAPPLTKYTPSSLPMLQTLPLPTSQSSTVTTIINKELIPLAVLIGETIQDTIKNMTSEIDYNNLLYYTIKQGTNLSPGAIAAFIANAPIPQFQGGGLTGNTGLATSLGGTDPLTMDALSTGVFLSAAKQFQIDLPQNVVNNLANLSFAILNQLSLSAASDTTNLLSSYLANLQPGSSAVAITLAGAFLNNALSLVGNSGTITLPAIESLLSSALPNLTSDQINELATALSSGQNLSILLFGALALALATRNSAFLNDIINSLPGLTGSDQNSNLTSPTLNSVLTQPLNNLLLSTELATNLLDNTTLNETNVVNIVTTAVNNVLNNLPQNVTASQLQNLFQTQFQQQGLSSTEAASLAQFAVNFAQSQLTTNSPASTSATPATTPTSATTPTQPLEYVPHNNDFEKTRTSAAASGSSNNSGNPSGTGSSSTSGTQNTSSAVNNSALSATIVAEISPELGTTAATAIANNITQIVDNPSNPNSLANLLAQHSSDLAALDQNTRDKVIATINEFVPSSVTQATTPSVLLQELLDPAYNITNSFMTGPMWDKGSSGKPHQWKRPLDINV